jgi:hypothetical protein
VNVTLDSKRVLKALVLLAVALMALSAGGWLFTTATGTRLGGFIRLVEANNEKSLPNWVSILQLAAAAALLAACAAGEARRGGRDVLCWRALAAGFAVMSLDELVGVHESAGRLLRLALGFDGFLRFAWVIPALALVATLAVCFSGFLRRLDAKRRNQFLIAGAVYLGGAVGLEMVGGKVHDAFGEASGAYALCYHAEELLELLGTALFISALIEHLEGLYGREGLAVRFSRG